MGNSFERKGAPGTGRGASVAYGGGSCKTALNKALSIALSFVLVFTMSPVSATQALAAEKFDEANITGGGGF